VPERIEVPNKTIQLPPQKPVQGKRGRSKAINQDVAPKRQRKQNNKNSELVNVTQQQVERHQVNKQNPHPTSTMHSISDVGTSERPDDIVLGNNELSQGVQEISINYMENHMTERRQLSTYTLPKQLLKLSKIIQIQRPWQSAKSARTGTNGKKQFKQS